MKNLKATNIHPTWKQIYSHKITVIPIASAKRSVDARTCILFVIKRLNKRDLAHAIHQNLFRTYTKVATGEHLTIKPKPLEEFSRGDK